MSLDQFLTDATALMQRIGALATTLLTVGGVVGQVIDKGKHLITVLIKPKPDKPADATASAAADAGLAPIEAGPITTKSEVAILVDINRRMLIDVGRYLDEQQIDADLIVVTNDVTYGDRVKFLDPAQPAEWEELVREFNTALGKIKRAVGRAKLHLFLTTPLPLALALGALLGTVDENTIVYHWEKGTYWPVIALSRDLRK